MSRRAAIFFRFLAFLAVAIPCRAAIRYEVSLAHPEQHLFRVTMEIPEVSGTVTVQMPAWNALYQIRDFSSHVQQVEASSGGTRLAVEKLDKQTWRVQGTGTVILRYASYWDEPGPFASQIDAEHAFINPAMILMYVPARRQESVQVTLSDVPAGWATGGPDLRPAAAGAERQPAGAEFPSYDEAVDSPMEAGKFEEFELPGFESQVRVILHGDNWRKREVQEQLRRICQYELQLMEGAPFRRYTFIYHVGRAAAGAGGGMEHANSTAIAIPSDQYLAGVSAHEFFHLWNVKRIRPASLDPVDYTREQYTRALWFAEGVTSTYGSYTLVRSGIWKKEQFYADLSQQISELEARPANRWQSAEQSSLDAWLEKYSLYERETSSVSYYTKGQVLGVLLDVLIRDRTGNAKSLDDVMRAMNREFAQTRKPYRDSQDVRATVEEVSGSSFEEFFEDYVRRAKPLPYAAVLALAGLELRLTERQIATLGLEAERSASGQLRIESVEPESPAGNAGLLAGDIIEKWNDGAGPRTIGRWLRARSPGEVLRLRINRDGKEREVEIRLGSKTSTGYEVLEDPHASEKPRRIREGLIRGVTQSARAAARP